MKRILNSSSIDPADIEAKKIARNFNIFVGFIGVFLFIFVMDAARIFLTGCRPSPHARALSQIKQIATSTIIYASDFDEILPNATSMPSVRAMLMPYSKNPNLYKPVPNVCDAPIFNFNVSGVENFATPLGQKESLQSFQSVVWYAPITSPKSYGVSVSSFDTSSRRVTTEKLLKYLQPQFPRKATLVPITYLADQDPLKGN